MDILIAGQHRRVRFLTAATVCGFLCGVPAVSQSLSVTVTPNPAPSGQTITVTARDASGLGLFTPGGCLVQSIRSGVPNGPIVRLFPCTLLPVSFPSCTSTAAPRMMTWNQAVNPSGFAPPGVYWFEIATTIGMFGPIVPEWHCVTIDGSVPTPVLAATNVPTWGSVFQMSLTAPTHPGEIYVTAISQSTNTGIPLGGGLMICLDPDFFFNLSFPSPNGILFGGFQGTLDGVGFAGGIAINIPNVGPGCLPLHAQAGVIAPGGALALTNDLHFTIQ